MWIVRCVVVVLVLAGCGTGPPGGAPSASRRAVEDCRWVARCSRGRSWPACRDPCRTAVVARVVDGDTLILRGQGRVRLIGVDAPETWLRHDCFGGEATRALGRLTPPGARVRVAGDVEPRDRYGRRLLYLWTRNGVFVNRELVRTGYARAMPVPPDTATAPTIALAEAAARREGSGIWRPSLSGCGLARRVSAGGR
jgi:endonuclease YncB( thermonuclease family)